MVSAARNISIVVLLLSICFASEHELPLHNREILFRLCDSAMIEILSTDIQHDRPVYLNVENDVYSLYFRQQFIHGLASKDIPVYIQADSAKTTLGLSVRESSIMYGKVFTESFFGERRTVRTIMLSLAATVTLTAEGKVIRTDRVSKTYVDTVAYSSVELLNDPLPSTTRYDKPELSIFDSLLEPAIVTIASGVVIYLFFTIRS